MDKEISKTKYYLMASDYIITMAGWGTIPEALLGKKKIAVLSIDNVAEDRNTIYKLKDMNLAVEVNYKKNFNLEEILHKLKDFKPSYDKYQIN